MQSPENISQTVQLFDAIFESAPVGIVVLQPDGTIITANPAFRDIISQTSVGHLTDILKCSPDEHGAVQCGSRESCHHCHLYQPVLSVLHGDDVRRMRTTIQLPAKDATDTRDVLVTAKRIAASAGQFILMIIEDITELASYQRIIKHQEQLSGFIGNDPAIVELRDKISTLADMDIPVLIQGESGTGKELVAHAIHEEGSRAGKPFVAINCGAVPETLLESELFGHVAGAFTGASKDRKGRFERANGGTIFLDEIGDISPAMQVKLLRVLQESAFEPVGGEKSVHIDVRVISASNKDIVEEMNAGNFREDLYYRLCVFPIFLPPLRQRTSDIPLLAQHILQHFIHSKGLPFRTLSKEALRLMKSYDWPGNVRELQNAIQFAIVQCQDTIISPAHLPPSISYYQMLSKPQKRRPRTRKIDREKVQQALVEADGNKLRAAELLGVSRSTLYRFFDME